MTDTLTAERELDALIGDFQVACEECMECSNSETMMERAILRNALRAKLLAATARITALEAALDEVLVLAHREADSFGVSRNLHDIMQVVTATRRGAHE